VDRVVVAALCRGRDEVLLCHRSAERRWYPNVWDFPGGHVELGETPLTALARELREEIGVAVDIDQIPETPDLRVLYDDLDVSVWALRSWTGDPVNRSPEEHDWIEWVRIDRAIKMTLAHPSYESWLVAMNSSGTSE
jgi:8-oxo-dGTP diphosphatase